MGRRPRAQIAVGGELSISLDATPDETGGGCQSLLRTVSDSSTCVASCRMPTSMSC